MIFKKIKKIAFQNDFCATFVKKQRMIMRYSRVLLKNRYRAMYKISQTLVFFSENKFLRGSIKNYFYSVNVKKLPMRDRRIFHSGSRFYNVKKFLE